MRRLALAALVLALLACGSVPATPSAATAPEPPERGPDLSRPTGLPIVPVDPWTCANAAAIEQALPEDAEPADPTVENYEPPVTLDNAVTPLQFLDALPDAWFSSPEERQWLRELMLKHGAEQPL